MALDKQMILNELGSVMNKLQSADCGCMGKLFSNQGQASNEGGQGGATMGSQLPTCGGCRRGCCYGHGGYGGHNHEYNAHCAGEPHNMNNPCMGMKCNPPKLYADTYNYLNSNLMQPIVKEVYQDLKSINPGNSVVNNPMANQMGLQQGGGAGTPGTMSMAQNQMPGSDMGGGMHDPNQSMNQQMGNQQMGNQQMGNQQMGNQQLGNQQMGDQQMGNQQMANQPMSQMGGMGQEIFKMMNGDGNMSGKVGQISIPGANAMSHGQYSAEMNNNVATYGGQEVQGQYMQQQDMSNPMNPNSQNAVGGNMQQNFGQPGASYKVNYSNPAAQQMSSNRGKPNYGQHTPGVTKFNEMFPGVMGGMGGDLGFDPMSIAIQMNPANQQQTAMSQMQKLMNGNPIERALDGANAANAAINQPTASQQNSPVTNQQSIPVQPGATQQQLQGYTNIAENEPNQGKQQAYGQQQQVYTSTIGARTTNQNQPAQQYQQQPAQQYQQQQPQQYQQQPAQQYQQKPAQQYQQQQPQQYQQQPAQQYQQKPAQQYQQQPPQQYQQQPPQQYQQQPAQQYQQSQNVDPNAQQYQQQQQNVDPNAQDNMYGGMNSDPNQQPPQSYSVPPTSAPGQQMIKEPIFPVDNSRNQPPSHTKYQKRYEYNTLGQPVEMLPARMYHQAPESNQQQTLSPQPISNTRNDQSRFVVKNTVSRISLMGSKPVGRTPSRGQLQQIYNQYKGSQSYTQQNIRPPVQGATFSEGKINVALANANQHRHVPVERVGGDTLANNQYVNNQIPVKGQPMGHTGDVPVPIDNKPHGDIVPTKEMPMKKTRNGLQDLVYTSYPTSAAWSFHGNNDRSPYSTGYRLRRA